MELSPDATKFREILDLSALGVQIFRQRMRREHPSASDEEIEAEVQAWLARPNGGPSMRREDSNGIPRLRLRARYL
jgi:hypothetical protein